MMVAGARPAPRSSQALINKANAAKVAALVGPGNYVLVRQGMEMKIVPTKDYEWPAPYKSSTEQYSPQVKPGPDGGLQTIAPAALPAARSNDPQTPKIMWNFQLNPSYSDDLDAQDS